MVEEICLTAAPGLSVVINWNARVEYARSSLLSSLRPPTARCFALHHLYFGVSKIPMRFFFFSRSSPFLPLLLVGKKKKTDWRLRAGEDEVQIYPLSRAWSLLGPARNRVFFRTGVDGPVRTLRREATTSNENVFPLVKKTTHTNYGLSCCLRTCSSCGAPAAQRSPPYSDAGPQQHNSTV